MSLVRTLAIDIGGTKFTLGAFDGDTLIARETRFTDRNGGPRSMLGAIREIYSNWLRELEFCPTVCGIGFGGPVDFRTQTVTLSTHVGGWDQYPLVPEISELTGAPTVMDNEANVIRSLGRSVI
jgi:glucokinase